MKVRDATAAKVTELHNRVRHLLQKGHTAENITTHLQQEQIEPWYVETIIANILKAQEHKRHFRNGMIAGISLIVAGIEVNFFSYRFSVASGSSTFLLF